MLILFLNLLLQIEAAAHEMVHVNYVQESSIYSGDWNII